MTRVRPSILDLERGSPEPQQGRHPIAGGGLAALDQGGFSAGSRVVARIGSGLSASEAELGLRDLAETLAVAHPDVSAGWTTVTLQSLKELEIGGVRSRRSRERLNAGLVGSFAAVALMLACVGMYGVVSFIVTLRTREIGVRMAVGAAPRRIAAGIVYQAAMIGAVGLLGGTAAAAALSPFVTSLLFDVSALDVVRYLVVATFLLALAALAAWVPARQASRLDPAMVLRSE